MPNFILGGLCAGIIALGATVGVGQIAQVQACSASSVAVEEVAPVAVKSEWHLTVAEQPLTHDAAVQADAADTCRTTLVNAVSNFQQLGLSINLVAIAIALAGLVWIVQMLIKLRRSM